MELKDIRNRINISKKVRKYEIRKWDGFIRGNLREIKRDKLFKN